MAYNNIIRDGIHNMQYKMGKCEFYFKNINKYFKFNQTLNIFSMQKLSQA